MKLEGRELKDGEKGENVVLRFEPGPAGDMLVDCLRSGGTGNDEPGLTFVRSGHGRPPPEVASV